MRLPSPNGTAAALGCCCILASAGCVRHEVALVPAPGPALQVAAGPSAARPLAAPVTLSSPLPQDLPITAWRHDGPSDALLRAETRARTPLPWWQRFPADIVTDLAPVTFRCTTEARLDPAPLAATDWPAVVARARAAGYAPTTPRAATDRAATDAGSTDAVR